MIGPSNVEKLDCITTRKSPPCCFHGIIRKPITPEATVVIQNFIFGKIFNKIYAGGIRFAAVLVDHCANAIEIKQNTSITILLENRL